MTLIEVSQEVSRGLRKENSQLERDVGKETKYLSWKRLLILG